MTKVEYVKGATLPDLALTLKDSAGEVIDFSTPHTFAVKVGASGESATFTKTTGITGAASSPNVTIAWATSAEITTLDAGNYEMQVDCIRTSDSKRRSWKLTMTVRPSL